MRHAIIENGVVTNIIEWDGNTPWKSPDEAIVVVLDDTQRVNPGDHYMNGVFASA